MPFNIQPKGKTGSLGRCRNALPKVVEADENRGRELFFQTNTPFEYNPLLCEFSKLADTLTIILSAGTHSALRFSSGPDGVFEFVVICSHAV